MDSIEDVVLVLVDQVKENSETLSLDDISSLQGLDELLDGFDIMSLVDFNEETINKKIAELQSAGKIVHTL